MLHFEGQQKSKDRDSYEIVTLVPSNELLARIRVFRAMPEVAKLMQVSEEQYEDAVRKLTVQINRECQKHLGEIVPPLEDRDRMSVHNLRSLYGAIATHFFCPEDHHEYAFIQNYLGHVTDSSATSHYFRYMLVDEEQQVITTKGILLGNIPPFPTTMKTESEVAAFLPEIGTLLNTSMDGLKESFWSLYEQFDDRLSSLESGPTVASNVDIESLQRENKSLKQQLKSEQSKLSEILRLLADEKCDRQQILEKYQGSSPRPKSAKYRALKVFEAIREWNFEHSQDVFIINVALLEQQFGIHRQAAKGFLGRV